MIRIEVEPFLSFEMEYTGDNYVNTPSGQEAQTQSALHPVLRRPDRVFPRGILGKTLRCRQ
jgi:hypothetical protein